MPGFSITLLLLPGEDDSDAPSTGLILSLLDDQPDVPGWKWNARSPPILDSGLQVDNKNAIIYKTPPGIVKFENREDIYRRVRKAAKALIIAEPEITRMDSIVGDGDCGLTLKVCLAVLLSHHSNYQTGWSRRYDS